MKRPIKKAIIVVSEDWYFLSHRLALARDLTCSGWEVVVATQVNCTEDATKITAAGLRLVSLPLERGRLFSLGDLLYVWRLFKLYQNERPQIVHHVAMKPVLWGSIAALGSRNVGVVNALAGLGYLFTNSRGFARLASVFVLQSFRCLFGRGQTRVILQNAQDMFIFHQKLRIPMSNLRLIRGAGVDVSRYSVVLHGPREKVVIVMVARMLRNKGVGELVEAARILLREGLAVRVQLVGGIDSKNPNSLSESELQDLQKEGVVEWLGHRNNIAAIYAASDVAVLPSYREGLPKALLEAAASGLPIVTTDTSGCREVVNDGLNGILVPIGDPIKLAGALRRLVLSSPLRARMGAASRKRAECEFRQELISEQTAGVYAELLNV